MTVPVAANAVDQAKEPVASAARATWPPNKVIHSIGVAYYNRGYTQTGIAEIKDNLDDRCDRMPAARCADYLHKALLEEQNSPDSN
jgi:hypothetical protein